jgi:sugar lactone lactonase YvrE
MKRSLLICDGGHGGALRWSAEVLRLKRDGALMRLCAALALVLLALVLYGGQAQAVPPGHILEAFAAPCASPSDLAWDGTNLWVADWREAVLYRVSPEDGSTLGTLDAPGYKPQGLAWGDGYLYVSDGISHKIYQLDPATGEVQASYDTPGSSPRGLAFDGTSLWLADDADDQIYELIPHDGTILSYFKAPSANLTALTWDGRYLWAADRIKDELHMETREEGEVLGTLDSPAPYPNGLAFGDGKLWVADFETQMIYGLEVTDTDPYLVKDSRETVLSFRHIIRNDGPGIVTEAVINVAVPPDSLENQVLYDVAFDGGMPEFLTDRWGQRVASFLFTDVQPGQSVEASYEARGKVGHLRYFVRPEKVGSLKEIPKAISKEYLVDGTRYRMDDPVLKAAVKEAVGDEKRPYWIARKIFNWVIGKLEYQMVGGWDVPATLIKRGTGSCSEYAFLYIAMCRSAGLPARYEAGTAVRGDDASVDEAYHRWVEVYLPNYGWVPVDPSRGDKEWPSEQAEAIGNVSNRLFITTIGGGDSEYLSWNYNSFAFWKFMGRATVVEDEHMVWRRAKAEGEEPVLGSVSCKPGSGTP